MHVPMTPHHRHEVPLFDVVMDTIVPTMSVLADDDSPVGRCTECGRLTWDPGNIGRGCFDHTPTGPCACTFARIA